MIIEEIELRSYELNVYACYITIANIDKPFKILLNYTEYYFISSFKLEKWKDIPLEYLLTVKPISKLLVPIIREEKFKDILDS